MKRNGRRPLTTKPHHTAFSTPYSTWEPQWSLTEHEVFRDFGCAAFKAQMLESSLIHILLAAELAGRLSFDKKRGIETEVLLSRKTLGQLIVEMKRGGIDERLTEKLQDALAARNFLMHHFFVYHAEDYVTEEGRGKMLKELQNLRFRIGRVNHMFSQIREHVYEKLFGITRDKLEQHYRKYLEKRSVGL